MRRRQTYKPSTNSLKFTYSDYDRLRWIKSKQAKDIKDKDIKDKIDCKIIKINKPIKLIF